MLCFQLMRLLGFLLSRKRAKMLMTSPETPLMCNNRLDVQ